MMGVGFRIKEILNNKNMTIKELSKLTGISINTLYAITKRDSSSINPVTLQKISLALDISIDQLTGITFSERFNIPEPGSAYDDFGTPDDKAHISIIDNLNKLNDTGKQEAVKRVEELTHIEKYSK